MPLFRGFFYASKKMTIQTVNLGTAPTGAGGDTFRSTGAKMNENFTNNTHAASRYVGTSTGNLMEVGAFGLGKGVQFGLDVKNKEYLDSFANWKTGFYTYSDPNLPETYGGLIRLGEGGPSANRWAFDLFITTSNSMFFRESINNDSWGNPIFLLGSANTTVDGNGFIKKASPIVKLFADKIESNDEAANQKIVFQKIDIGHYLIKGSSGFAQEGWYIETPKDANGNILFAVNYKQLENSDIEVKTYKKKFDLESASIVADLENPVDITLNRWIDIRLQEVPKPVREMPTEEVNSDEPQQ